MPYNLAELDAEQKNLIELDKQAAFMVWKLKQATIGPDAIVSYGRALRSEVQKSSFEQSVIKYKKQMGVAWSPAVCLRSS